MEKQTAVEKLYHAIKHSDATNFHALLYRLFFKADSSNFKKLEAGFPKEAEVVKEYKESTDPEDFWDEYGLQAPRKKKK